MSSILLLRINLWMWLTVLQQSYWLASVKTASCQLQKTRFMILCHGVLQFYDHCYNFWCKNDNFEAFFVCTSFPMSCTFKNLLNHTKYSHARGAILAGICLHPANEHNFHLKMLYLWPYHFYVYITFCKTWLKVMNFNIFKFTLEVLSMWPKMKIYWYTCQ